ncbi:MAG: hypothetical protein L3K19_03135 [Thermoplasmata archaeon]|nr:hypothetical protein [Thermoplasmata archaeon]
MTEPAPVPTFRELSPTMRVDVLIADWRAALLPELSAEEQEANLYGQAWEAYLEGDYGFGLWCWREVDRLTNSFQGKVGEVTRVVGQGRYLGFSHRKAIAAKIPIDKVYRPRKGDMSTPRTDAIVLAQYQLLCVYAVRAREGDAKSKALYEIALGELEERRRADPFIRHFDTFRRLLERPTGPSEAVAPVVVPDAPPAAALPVKAKRPRS